MEFEMNLDGFILIITTLTSGLLSSIITLIFNNKSNNKNLKNTWELLLQEKNADYQIFLESLKSSSKIRMNEMVVEEIFKANKAIQKNLYLLERFFDRKEITGENRNIKKDFIELRKIGLETKVQVKCLRFLIDESDFNKLKEISINIESIGLVEAYNFLKEDDSDTKIRHDKKRQEELKNKLLTPYENIIEQIYKKYKIVN